MARKRSNGDGSICRRKDGQWIVVVSYQDPASGKRRRATRYAKSQSHGRIVLDELREEIFRPPPAPSALSLSEFLHSWLKESIAPNKSPATLDSYTRAVDNHIVPLLGAIRVVDLAPFHVQSWLAELATVGARTRQNAFVVLQAGLNHAMRLQVIKVNPCAPLDKPKADREEIMPFSATEAQRIILETEDDRLGGVYAIALLHGLRQGELFGLRWPDVNLDRQTLRIEQQACEVAGHIVFRSPKSKAGRRTISISDRAAEALTKRRAAALAEGNAGCELVFPNRSGEAMRRSNFGARHWSPLLAELGLEHRGFHHCRHTAATLMLGSGVPVHEVSRIIGHAKPSITLDVYSHWIPAQKSAGTDAASRAIFG